jgi:hypothetical protein
MLGGGDRRAVAVEVDDARHRLAAVTAAGCAGAGRRSRHVEVGLVPIGTAVGVDGWRHEPSAPFTK